MLNSKLIYIVAGEASGDMLAASLAKELKRQDPSLVLRGLGGNLMHRAGVELDLDITHLAVVGFWEVLKHYRTFKRIFEQTLKRLQADPPAAVILVDYPGFNLRLAQRIKELNIPTKVIYYVSPQVWAWKAKRVEHIQKYVDRMLVLFEFEKEFYARRGVEVDFVGHPLADEVRSLQPRRQVLRNFRLGADNPAISLLPGSRVKEVERHLPAMIEAVKILRLQRPDLQCLIIQAPTIDLDFLQSFTRGMTAVKIVEYLPYDAIAASDVCLVASGTATLETALLEIPMVVMYQTSWPTYWLARRAVKIPHISLVNIVAQKKIVPELIQDEASAQNLAAAAAKILDDPAEQERMLRRFKDVRAALGESGASEKTAKRVLEIIG